MLIVALCLSAIAAFYSIIGLTAIFAAAVVPVIVMGTALEVAKLTVTVWLHEYWDRCKLSMKLYLVPAVAILMVITSMGIFGFLSKAHLDQTVPTGDVQAQVALIDEKINNERETIANARTLLAQLDKAVTDIGNTPDREVNGRTVSSAERALQVRRAQARDRDNLTRSIEASQARIVKLQEEKAPFAKELRKVEAEVGPIKYIASLIYGDNPDDNLLEKAVRWVIIILVVVFDPLAIFMLLAATESYRWERQARAQRLKEEEKDGTDDVDNKSIAQDLDGQLDRDDSMVQPATELVAETTEQKLEQVPPPSDAPEPVVDATLVADEETEDQSNETDEEKRARRAWKEANPDDTIHRQKMLLEQGKIDRLPWQESLRIQADDANHVNVDFGTAFPLNPVKGDTYIRVDYLPSRLFKWNDTKWIEVDKDHTDSFTYNENYIDHLIAKISSGEYDPDLLNDNERQQIEQRLRDDNKPGGINV
jgi:hypothetical protein